MKPKIKAAGQDSGAPATGGLSQRLAAQSKARAAKREARLRAGPADYVKYGWSLCRIPLGSKGPTTPGWNIPGAEIRTEDGCKQLAGVGVGLLHVPSRTCALDVDDMPRAIRLLDAEGIDLQALLDAPDAVQIVGRAGRAKLLYAVPEAVDPALLATRKLGQGALELRCAASNGLTVQDVLPPSIHPITGRPYQWAGRGDWWNPPPLPDVLLDLWRRVLRGDVQHAASASAHSGGVWCEGERHDRLNGEAYRLRKQGVSPDGIERLLRTINAERCVPPLPDVEVASIARSKAGIAPDGLQEWPEHRPILDELLPAPAFDAAALLPPTLGAFVLDEAERMGCPPDFVAAALIVALGSVIGARAGLKMKRHDDWIVVPSLWGGIVGSPASKKSPAIAAVTRFLDRAEKQAADRIADDSPIHRAEMVAFEAQKSAIEAKMRRLTASGDPDHRTDLEAAKAEYAALRPPEEPRARRFKSNDSTTEKLGELLIENPAGVLVFRDELVGLLSTWDRDGREGDRAFYLEAWAGTGTFSIDRIGRGSLLIPNMAVSIFGGIQPDLLEKYLAAAAASMGNDGLFQRFSVLVYPDPIPYIWRDKVPDKGAREAVRDVFDRLANFDPLMDGAEPATEFVKLPYFRFDSEAQEVFIEWSGSLHADIAAEPNALLAQHFAKLEKAFGAVALIAHLAAGHVGPVTVESARHARAWMNFLTAHARRVYALIESAKVGAARLLGRRLAEGKLPDGFTARDVMRKGWRGLNTGVQIEQALATLEEHGWVIGVDVPSAEQGGRPTERFHVNPRMVSSVSTPPVGAPTGLNNEAEVQLTKPTKPRPRIKHSGAA